MTSMRIEAVEKASVLLRNKSEYVDIFTDTVKGRECKVGVKHYLHQPPLPHTWDSSDDYYGYTEFEVELLNNDGSYSELFNSLMNKSDYERYLHQYELMQEANFSQY